MATISIAYLAPVQVVVDTDTGAVTRVVVIDEEVRPEPDGYCEDQDTYQPATSADVDRAYAIAEGHSTQWPGWQFGW